MALLMGCWPDCGVLTVLQYATAEHGHLDHEQALMQADKGQIKYFLLMV
jgi:hypothetical protein